MNEEWKKFKDFFLKHSYVYYGYARWSHGCFALLEYNGCNYFSLSGLKFNYGGNNASRLPQLTGKQKSEQAWLISSLKQIMGTSYTYAKATDEIICKESNLNKSLSTVLQRANNCNPNKIWSFLDCINYFLPCNLDIKKIIPNFNCCERILISAAVQNYKLFSPCNAKFYIKYKPCVKCQSFINGATVHYKQ